MKLLTRVIIVATVLVIGVITQQFLYAYLSPAEKLQKGELSTNLSDFPKQIGNWVGQDKEVTDETMKTYPDEYVHRTYVLPGTNEAVMLWMAYSKVGKDRAHHPEVCYAVQGMPEDEDYRQTVDVAGHEAPVQQFRFGFEGKHQLVYYWHYLMPSPGKEKLDKIQSLHHALGNQEASITIEVFAPDRKDGDASVPVDFVKQVDAALQDFLPQEAIRGSDRQKVEIINAE